MAAPTDGPVLGQSLVVLQGAPKLVKYVVPDASGVLVGATGTWWAGPAPVVGGPSIAGAPGAISRPGLVGTADGLGNTVYPFTIGKADLAAFDPRAGYQHELWVREPGIDPYPAAIGPLTVYPTIGGRAP